MLSQGRTGGIAALASVISVAAIIGTAPAALAAAPTNDDRGDARVVHEVPFTDTVGTNDATSQENDPDCFDAGPSPTVWYSFTSASDELFVATTAGSDYDTTLTLGTPGPGGLDIMDCSDDDGDGDTLTSRIAWHAEAGVEYLVMVGSFDGHGGALEFAIRRPPPPPSFELSIARSGALTPRGAVEVRGVLRCEGTRDRQWIEVSGRQDMRRRIISGFRGRLVTCDRPWMVRLHNGEFRFARGMLIVRASVEWCTDFDCGLERARRVVRVR